VSVYHTPRCRITWTNVHSDGVDRDVVMPDRPLTLFFGLEFDPAFRAQASGFRLQFALLTLGRFGAVGGVWEGPIDQLPGTTGNM
jgi:hypothetical protein